MGALCNREGLCNPLYYRESSGAPTYLQIDDQQTLVRVELPFEERIGPLVDDGRTTASQQPAQGLQAPLLQDASLKEAEEAAPQQQQKPKQQPKRQWRRTCLHLVAPVPVWLVATLIGWVLASTIHVVLRLHSVVAFEPQQSFDFTLRLAEASDRCIGIGNAIGYDGGFEVALKPCKASWDEQFLVKPDGTIRFKSNNDLCLTMSNKLPSKQIVMTDCADGSSHEQTFDVLPTGRIASHADDNLCMNLLDGDMDRGFLGMYECGKDLKEVFVYGGEHFLVPRLLRQWDKVKMLDAEMAHTVRLVIWALPSCFVAGVVALAFSRRLLKASGTSHGCCLQSIHGLAFLCVAAAIFLLLGVVTCMSTVTWVAQQSLNGEHTTNAATPDVDFTLRIVEKIGFCIGAVGGLHDQASVTLQRCQGDGLQQFTLQTDGTVRARQRDDLCLTRDSSHWQLQTCSASSAGRQVFSAVAQSHGWLQLKAQPDRCMNLLWGDVAKGDLGVYACGEDINEVFVYSGGNAGIAELALHLNDVQQAFPEGLTKALRDLDGFPVIALQRAAEARGAACALLVAVPSLLLLLGRKPAREQHVVNDQ